MLRILSIVSALALVATITSASAAVLISSDNGGRIGDYEARFAALRHSGQQVVIDGPCLSACTMVLGLVPRNRICATANAALGFHAAWQPDGAGGHVTSEPATRHLLAVYPPQVRAWIARRGGLSQAMMFLTGAELAAVVPTCATRSTADSAQPPTKRSVRWPSRSGGVQARQAPNLFTWDNR